MQTNEVLDFLSYTVGSVETDAYRKVSGCDVVAAARGSRSWGGNRCVGGCAREGGTDGGTVPCRRADAHR